MTTAIVVVAVVVAILVVAALALTNPMMKKREEVAVKALQDKLGKDKINLMEPRATAMGVEPEDDTGLRGMSALAATDDELLAVSWSGLKEWSIQRSSMTAVDTAADDPSAVSKVSIMIVYKSGDSAAETTAMFRLRSPVAWLKELGYDWGPDGPPPDEDSEEESHEESE